MANKRPCQHVMCDPDECFVRPDPVELSEELAAARAEIERLTKALTEAANQISDLATRLGRAEGRLVASELVGVVEGWKARAEKAEAERDEARRLAEENRRLREVLKKIASTGRCEFAEVRAALAAPCR